MVQKVDTPNDTQGIFLFTSVLRTRYPGICKGVFKESNIKLISISDTRIPMDQYFYY